MLQKPVLTLSFIAVLLAAFISFGAGASLAGDTAKADELFKKGDALLDAGKLEEARAALEAAVSADSKHYGALISLGITYAELNMLDKSFESFSSAIEIKPDEVPPLLNRGEVSIMKNDYDSACKDFLKACNLGQCRRLDIATYKNRCKPNY